MAGARQPIRGNHPAGHIVLHKGINQSSEIRESVDQGHAADTGPSRHAGPSGPRAMVFSDARTENGAEVSTSVRESSKTPKKSCPCMLIAIDLW